MTSLDRRDRRRALATAKEAPCWIEGRRMKPHKPLIDAIAAALKRERNDTGMGAINWFLFSDRSTTAKAKRAIAQKYCTRKHCSGLNCNRPRKPRKAVSSTK